MRLGGRLAAAIEVLEDIETRNRPAADAMRDWGLSHRFAGSGDRAAIGNLVYGALRRKDAAAWLFGESLPRALVLGSYLFENGLNVDALTASIAGDSFAPPPVTVAERASVTSKNVAGMAEIARAHAPDWCLPSAHEAFGP